MTTEIPSNVERATHIFVKADKLAEVVNALAMMPNVIRIVIEQDGIGFGVTAHYAIMDLERQFASVAHAVEELGKRLNRS